MSNRAISGNSTVAQGIEALSARLPGRWSLLPARKQPDIADYRPDAVLEMRASDGNWATVLVEAKPRLTAQQAADLAPRLAAAAEQAGAAAALLVTRFASRTTRQRLREAGVSYLDLTGNLRIVLDRPALFIETQGADRDPNPPRRGIKSLKGAKAARLVRALCDWRPPVGVRELARRAGTDPGYATRVLTLLEQEDVVRRASGGEVAAVKWQDLLRRWIEDYQVAKTNRAVPCLSPRGLDAFTERLQSFRKRFALTGSLAAPAAASVAPGRVASCYVDDPEGAIGRLDVRPTDTGANVLLLEPFDPIVYERTREQAGLTLVAVSQCAVDLLTGTGREPSEADSLMAWMGRNESAWRS